MKTKVIDNFKGSMTSYSEGDLNSGFSFVQNSAGANPFRKPGNLTWSSAAQQIDAAGSIITDLIMCGKERVESGILYVYAVGSSGRVYKIQVNKPSTNDPNFDTPVLLATITSGSPTFTRGGFIDFYGTTERIYIGHDKGVTRIDFDGTNETAVSGTWTQNVPRPLKQFLGSLLIGNGSNIAIIDTTATQTFAAKLSPGFPTNSQVRDMDVTPDGNYIQIVVTQLALPNILAVTQDTTTIANSDSFIFSWNGTDTGYTSFNTFPTFSLTANTIFGNSQYTFGYDLIGGAVYNPTDKLLTLQEVQSPMPNALSSTGNIVSWMTPLWFEGFMEADIFFQGTLDFEVGPGFWDVFFQFSSGTDTDIIQVPFQMPVSNFGLGASSNGYTGNIFGTSKTYFSTLEIDGATPHYKFWKWIFNTSPNISDDAAPIEEAVYQTQTQLFSKKQKISEIRIYSEPWVANNEFRLDLIGSSGGAITGGSKTFTAQNSDASAPMYIGTDYAWWNPQIASTYALGLYIINLGTANFVITKIEVDYEDGGK